MKAAASRLYHALLLLLLGAVAAAGTAALLPLLDFSTGLAAAVDTYMDRSGVDHPLTAVLLNFRGYDTLLEIGVLFIAVVAVRSITAGQEQPAPHVPPYERIPELRVALGVLIPLTVVTAGYMVWVGFYEPGGAFQGGAMIGAAWVLLLVSGVVPVPLTFTAVLRFTAAMGFFYFMAAALAAGLANGSFLAYPESAAGKVILSIETLLSVSIGSAIGILFASVYQAAVTGGGGRKGGAS